MNKSEIACSLSLGVLLNKKQKIATISVFVVAVILFIVASLIFIFPLELDNVMIIAAIFCFVISILFFILSIFIMFKDKKVKKKISIWIQHAVCLSAYSKAVDFFMEEHNRRQQKLM